MIDVQPNFDVVFGLVSVVFGLVHIYMETAVMTATFSCSEAVNDA